MHTNKIKSEADFINELEKKVSEQRQLTKTEILPNWAKGIGEWVVINPWRVLIPVSGILYMLLRLILGTSYREVILAIFGGFV